MLSLREFRTKLQGLADLLPWAALVDPGIILNKDGSLTTAFYFRGQDLASATGQELDAVAVQTNAALAKLETGWMINIDSIRSPVTSYPSRNQCHFPDPVTLLIDEERRSQNELAGARYDSVYALAITYLLPTEMHNRITALFIMEDEDQTSKQASYTNLLELYKRRVQNITDGLLATLNLRPMSSDELLTYLHRCVSGLDTLVATPPIPMYLDALLATRDFYAGLAPRIGTTHIRTITVHGFPGQTMPGMLDQLNQLPFPYRWSTRFIALDVPDAEKRLKTYRRNWWQKRHGLIGMLRPTPPSGDQSWQNGDAVAMAGDADQAMTENNEGLVRYGYYTNTIIVMDEDLTIVDQNAREVTKLLANNQCPANVEDMNAVEAYLGSLPANGFSNIRRPMIHSLNLAHLLPLTAVWSGHAEHPAPADMYPPHSPPLLIAATAGATPLRVSLHVGDLGHFGIFGPPGAGKSTFLDLLITSHFRYPNAQVFGFDYGYSMYTLCVAAGGAHYDIGAEGSPHAFCPLAQLETAGDLAWAAQYLELLVTLRLPAGAALSVGQQNEIAEALANMAADTALSRHRTITNIRSSIQDRDIKEALKYYTLDGPLGHLLDCESDSLSGTNGRFFVFETTHLLELGDRAVIPVFMHIFRQIEKRVTRRVPTLIPIDEGWKTFSHPLAIDRLKQWLKTMRKENAAVGFTTQNLTDILNSPIAPIIIDNIPTKFMLANPEAATENVAPIYRSFGLNDTEIALLSTARPKRDYYLTNADGRRSFQLRLGPVALAFVGISGKEQVQIVRQMQTQYGPDWVYHWLLARGVPLDWANHWRLLASPGQISREVA